MCLTRAPKHKGLHPSSEILRRERVGLQAIRRSRRVLGKYWEYAGTRRPEESAENVWRSQKGGAAALPHLQECWHYRGIAPGRQFRQAFSAFRQPGSVGAAWGEGSARFP